MALNKNFDLGDISFGETKSKKEEVTREVNRKSENKEPAQVKESEKKKEESAKSTVKEESIKNEETETAAAGVKLVTNKKNLKTEHKNFLFDRELAEQLKKVSKKTGLSENEIVSQILKQTLPQLMAD